MLWSLRLHFHSLRVVSQADMARVQVASTPVQVSQILRFSAQLHSGILRHHAPLTHWLV